MIYGRWKLSPAARSVLKEVWYNTIPCFSGTCVVMRVSLMPMRTEYQYGYWNEFQCQFWYWNGKLGRKSIRQLFQQILTAPLNSSSSKTYVRHIRLAYLPYITRLLHLTKKIRHNLMPPLCRHCQKPPSLPLSPSQSPLLYLPLSPPLSHDGHNWEYFNRGARSWGGTTWRCCCSTTHSKSISSGHQPWHPCVPGSSFLG